MIIPVYNGGKYLKYSLRSVQNQKMKDIEIIIVDDNSSDDSLNIIQNYIKQDGRIRLIKNRVNRNILYSKSIGAINAKGQYIIELDQDDIFIRENAFDLIYNEAIKYESDLVRFNNINNDNILNFNMLNIISKNKFDNIIFEQPELKKNNFKNKSWYLWGLLIHTDLYKKVVYNLWPIIINYKITFQEDFIITFFLFNYAKKCVFINKALILYWINSDSASKNFLSKQEYYLSILFAGIIFYDYYFDYNSKDISIIMNYIDFLKYHIKTAKFLYFDFFNYYFAKLITNKDLPSEQKKFLMKYYQISENCDSYEYLNITTNSFQNIILSRKNNNKKKVKPLKISIIIINSNYKLINDAINLLNNQKFDYYEIIIIVNSNEKNKIFKKYNNINSKLKIIQEKEKIGFINSISKAVLMAKGKYVMIFNPLSSFINSDTFENIFFEIEKSKSDILEFDLYKRLANNYLIVYKCKHSKSKFNFTQIKYNMDYKNIDINKELLSNKIIRTEYFKNIINLYGIYHINEDIDYYYNELFYFSLESIPHKFAHINKLKLYLNETDFDKINFNDFLAKQSNIMNETINYINFIFEHSSNTFEAKKKIFNEYLSLLSVIYNKYVNISESSINLYNKFINCNYISKENKTNIEFYIKSLIN